ncbi:MAG: hypothetical protein GY866_03190, partial [Proteobacteria bacterium]|nr:hypothetical protein [Pseudomonadota bacterium]
GAPVYATKFDAKTGKVEIVLTAVTKFLQKENIAVTPTVNCLKVVVPSSPASIGVTYEKPVSDRFEKFGINEQDVSHAIPPKYAKLLENIKNGYDVEIDGTVKSINGKHIVFTEEKSNHNKIARILANGLPIDRKKICIINADTCGSNSKTNAITEGFNSGKHTIAICNKKAEVGLNMQKGTCQGHNLDFRWTPASLTQRDGRFIRQGNESEFARSSKYLVAGSFDAFKLQILEKKAGWTNKVLKGDEETIESDQSGKDDMIMEMLAALSGNAEEFYETERKKREKELRIKRERKVRGYSNTLNQIQHISRYLNNGGETKEKDAERVKLETQISSEQSKWDEQIAKNSKNKEKLASMLEELQAEGIGIKEFKELSDKEYAAIKKIPNDERTKEQKFKLRADGMLKRGWDDKGMEDYYGRAIKSRQGQLENLDNKYSRIRKEKEDLLRMKKGALQKAKDLPFDISVLDNPESALVTQQGVSWELGKSYVLEKDEKSIILKVSKVDPEEQTVSVEYLLGGKGPSTFAIMDLNTTVAKHNPKPCTMSEDEINLKRSLQEGIKYDDLPGKLSREAFVENVGELSVYGYLIYEDESGEITAYEYGSYGRVNAKEKKVLYPDVKSESFKSAVFKAYLKKVRENSSDDHYMLRALRNVFKTESDDQIDSMAAEYGEKLPESEIRLGVMEEWEELFQQAKERVSDKELYPAAINRLSGYNFADNLIKRVGDKGDNRADMIRIAEEYIEAKKAEYQREIEALEEADKERYKKHPDYIDVPSGVKKAFADIGLVVKPNMTDFNNYGQYGAFSRWLVWNKSGGRIFRGKKDILMDRYPSLTSLSGMKGRSDGIGDGDTFWWHFPSSVDLNDLLSDVKRYHDL